MQNDVILDISENAISHLNVSLLEILLFDRTTRKNILWATDDYAERGISYAAGDEIKPDLITGVNGNIIRSRVLKATEQKVDRTRTRAEVFTPSWVCNQQNNLIDEQWFEGKQVFNVTEGTTWTAIDAKIPFPEKGMKTWKKYVDARRMEITCGEAPYLVSRYDTVTGITIPFKERIGLLDRKLRVVNENTDTREDWMIWAKRAIESIYGYEFQGDNLLLARENVLYTYIEYYRKQFGDDPDIKTLKEIALVISWNLWQMDGFNCAIPYCKVNTEPEQLSLFDLYPDDMGVFDYKALLDTKGQSLCKIRDWRSKETVLYKNIVGGKEK